MKKEIQAVKFDGHTDVYGATQKDYVYAYCVGNPEGEIITCWHIPFLDRLRILFSGKLWHHILTFNKPLQPQRLVAKQPPMPKW